MRQLSIGELSRRTGCNVETIRYYERTGLLPKPLRSSGGHRVYGDGDVRRLGFILNSRNLGFSIDQVRDLLTYSDGGEYTCAEVKALAEGHLAEVRHKLAELDRRERALKGLIAACNGGDLPGCPILEALYA